MATRPTHLTLSQRARQAGRSCPITEAEIYAGIGLFVIGAAWSPLFLKSIPVSLPMVALASGVVLAGAVRAEHPIVQHSTWVEHVTALALVVSVMGAGLRLDRPFSAARWGGIWRLLAIVMPLSIVALVALGKWLLQLSLADALLVGAILAPTDPVLANAVQAGPPGSDDESDARFNLTGEAGLNDGLVFPFVMLSLGLAAGPQFGAAELGTWFLREMLWALVAGVGSGIALGRILVWINRRLSKERRLSATKSGFVALGLSLLTYGIAEAIGANGFIAVFVLAVTIRNALNDVEYPRQLNHFLSEMEQLVMVMVVVLFGVAVGNGLLGSLTLPEFLFALVTLFVIRPVATWLGLQRSGLARNTRAALSYFGIRGLGALYYLTYTLRYRGGDLPAGVTTAVGLVVLLSIIVYGVTTEPVVRRLQLDNGTGSAADL